MGTERSLLLSACSNQQAVVIARRVCEARTGGFGDFLAEARVSWLKGIFDNNKEVFG